MWLPVGSVGLRESGVAEREDVIQEYDVELGIVGRIARVDPTVR